MANLYTKLQKDARAEMLHTLQTTDKKIATIYKTAADDLTKLSSMQKAGSLTQRWQTDMAASLMERMGQLNQDVHAAVKAGSATAASLPAEANAQWLTKVLEKAKGTTSGDAFRSVMTRTSDEALRAVVNGDAYLDARTLSKRIWNNNAKAREGMNEILQQGIAQKKSAYKLAKELEAYVNPDVLDYMDWREIYPDMPAWLGERWTKVEFHAHVIARTSINHAHFLAMKNAAAANPFTSAIHWELSPDHYERQIRPFGEDICDDYAGHDEGLGTGNFTIEGVPLPHAMCLCYQWAVTTKTLDECATQLSDWLDGGDDEDLEAAFSDWKDQLAV